MLYCETKKFLIKKIHTIFVFSCIRRKKYTLKKAHQYMRTQKKTSKNFKQVKVKSQQHSTNCCVAFFPFHSFVCLFVKNPRPHQHMRISPPRIQEFFYLGKKNSLGNLLQLWELRNGIFLACALGFFLVGYLHFFGFFGSFLSSAPGFESHNSLSFKFSIKHSLNNQILPLNANFLLKFNVIKIHLHWFFIIIIIKVMMITNIFSYIQWKTHTSTLGKFFFLQKNIIYTLASKKCLIFAI